MEDNIEETTQQNPAEETAVEETQEETTEVKETPIQKTDHTDAEKRAYARMKEAEDSAKKAKAELKKVQDELAKAKIPISDVDAILEVQSSTRDLDNEEVAELKLRASSIGKSLSEARQDKNYQLWQKAHREAVEKENSLKPSTKQDEVDRPKSYVQRLNEATTQEEKEKILNEMGLNPLNPNRNINVSF